MIRAKKTEILEKTSGFLWSDCDEKKTPSPTEEVQLLDSSGLSFVLMGTSWISALRRRHRAFPKSFFWCQSKSVSFCFRPSANMLMVKKNWCRYHQFEGTRGASPLLLLMVQKSSTPVEVGS